MLSQMMFIWCLGFIFLAFCVISSEELIRRDKLDKEDRFSLNSGFILVGLIKFVIFTVFLLGI